MADFNRRANRYDHTPRKVFDKGMDRMELRIQRVKEDYRNDFQAIFHRMENIEQQLFQVAQEVVDLAKHVDRHCGQLDKDRGTEGLE